MTGNSRIPKIKSRIPGLRLLGQAKDVRPRMAQKRVGLLDICALRGWLARDRAVFLI